MIRELHLLRHAKSDWRDPTLDDRDRPLSKRGIRAATAMSMHIEQQGIRPRFVLCSPARRTRDTLDIVHEALGRPEVCIDPRLYGGVSYDILAFIRALPAQLTSAMLVGHNPGMQDLALLLARVQPRRDEVLAGYPTGALATLASDQPWSDWDSGAAQLVRFVVPRRLGG